MCLDFTNTAHGVFLESGAICLGRFFFGGSKETMNSFEQQNTVCVEVKVVWGLVHKRIYSSVQRAFHYTVKERRRKIIWR